MVHVIQVTTLAEQLALLHREQQDWEDQHRQQQQHLGAGTKRKGTKKRGPGGYNGGGFRYDDSAS